MDMSARDLAVILQKSFIQLLKDSNILSDIYLDSSLYLFGVKTNPREKLLDFCFSFLYFFLRFLKHFTKSFRRADVSFVTIVDYTSYTVGLYGGLKPDKKGFL